MTEVNIRSGDLVLALPVNRNGNMDLSTLKAFFKEAEGLVYTQNGIVHGLAIVHDEILLNPAIRDYDIFMSKSCSTVPSSTQKRVKLIMETIRNNKENNEMSEMSTSGKRKRLETINQVIKVKKPKEKKIHVGWIHRESEAGRYTLIKTPLGGTKVLQLNEDTAYLASEILTIAVQEFSKNPIVSDLLKTCKISLGFYDGTEIPQFEDQNQKPCHLWNFCKSKGTLPYRLRLYLLSTAQNERNTDKDNGVSQLDYVECAPTVSDKPDLGEETQNCKYDNSEKFDDEIPNTLQNSESKCNICEFEETEDLEIDYVYEYLAKSEADNVKKSEDKSAKHEQNALQEDKPEDTIKIYYQRFTVSKYSKLPSIMELSKKDAYYHESMLHTLDPELVTEDDFDPLDYGYYIGCIKVNGVTLFYIELQDDLTKTYHFPSVDLTTKKAHEILYDDNMLNGYCEGKYGVGIIPFCDDTCKPIITWRKNGTIVRQQLCQYWFDSSELISDIQAVWTCQVTCNGGKLKNVENLL